MSNLNSFKRSAKATTDGVWKTPNPDIALRILCRGRTDEFSDFMAARQRKAAKGFGGDFDSMPIAARRKITAQAMIEKLLIDVDFKDDNGNSVPFDVFCETILDPDYQDLLDMAWFAVAMATADRESDVADATKN